MIEPSSMLSFEAMMIYLHNVPQHDAAAKLSTAVAQNEGCSGLGVDPARLHAGVRA